MPRTPVFNHGDMIADDIHLTVCAVVSLNVFALVAARNFPFARVNLRDERGVVHNEITNQLIPVLPAAASNVLHRPFGIACVVRRIHTDGRVIVCHRLALKGRDRSRFEHLALLAVDLEEATATVFDAELVRRVFLHPRAADRDAVTHEESLGRLCHVRRESCPVECFQWTFPPFKF